MVRKSPRVIPNQRLKEERQMRGWSQQYVADQIGADYYYLSRWERGTASPSPFYRQKLCALFEKNAYELGFLSEKTEDEQEQDEQQSMLPLSSLQDMLYTFALPSSGVTGLIGREELCNELGTQLCVAPRSPMIALYGLPGVGKTTLAAALLTHKQIIEYFSDGFLWASLGPQPNLSGTFSRWGQLLGITDIEASRLITIEQWSQALHHALGNRRMLLVLDDVWKCEDALALKIAGAHCSYLVTTRFIPVALQLAGNGARAIQELAEPESLQLLEHLAPGLVEREPQAAQNLVRSVGGLPLALTLIGKHIRIEMHSGQPRRLFTALARLHAAEERLRLSVPQALYERPPALPPDRPVSLETIIAVSDQLLSDCARQTLRALAIFPPKPASFSEDAALAVSNTSVEVLDTLTDAGLLECAGIGRYTLHQVIADYARLHLQDQTSRLRFVAYFTDYAISHEQDYEALEMESHTLLAALDTAARLDSYQSFIAMIRACMRFWLARGWYSRTYQYLLQAEQFARTRQDTATQATLLLLLGEVALNQGNYEQARIYAEQGLQLARQHKDTVIIGDLLVLLGRVGLYQSNYQAAYPYLQEGLQIAQKYSDARRQADVLKALGGSANEQGHYDEAQRYLQEGLQHARTCQDHALIIETLVGLGQNEAYRGNFLQAEQHWQEALPLARRLGYLHAINILLGNLGAVAMELAQYDAAKYYLLEALQYSRQRENSESICSDLGNLGNLALEQGDYAQAHYYLQEALELVRKCENLWLQCGVLQYWAELHLRQPQPDLQIAQKTFEEVKALADTGLRDCQAEALFGLARVSLELGDTQAARQQARESLTIFEEIGNRSAARVRHWLEQQRGREA